MNKTSRARALLGLMQLGSAACADDTDKLSCDERATAALDDTVAALKSLDQSCTTDADCTTVSGDTKCNAGCTPKHAVSLTGAKNASTMLEAINQHWCRDFSTPPEKSGCETLVAGCDEPGYMARCVSNACAINTAAH
ncbi:MAG: hypothetical protein JWN04_715 [Myxococcaceae bacterium]|nr:hypothetical protein [Myxococcaceae bacterium]